MKNKNIFTSWQQQQDTYYTYGKPNPHKSIAFVVRNVRNFACFLQSGNIFSVALGCPPKLLKTQKIRMLERRTWPYKWKLLCYK